MGLDGSARPSARGESAGSEGTFGGGGKQCIPAPGPAPPVPCVVTDVVPSGQWEDDLKNCPRAFPYWADTPSCEPEALLLSPWAACTG